MNPRSSAWFGFQARDGEAPAYSSGDSRLRRDREVVSAETMRRVDIRDRRRNTSLAYPAVPLGMLITELEVQPVTQFVAASAS